MGYRVEYGNIVSCNKQKNNTVRRYWMCALCFGVFLVLVSVCWPQGQEILEDIFLPDVKLWTAAEALAGNLKDGCGISDSVAVFCRDLFGKSSAFN